MHVVLLIENEGKSPFLFLYDTTPLFLFCFNSNVSPKKPRRKNQRLCRLQRKCREEGKRKALSSKTHIKKKKEKNPVGPKKRKAPRKNCEKYTVLRLHFWKENACRKGNVKWGTKSERLQ